MDDVENALEDAEELLDELRHEIEPKQPEPVVIKRSAHDVKKLKNLINKIRFLT